MNTEAEIPIENENRKLRLIGRVILFLFINGPTTMLALGMWIRVGAHTSAHAASKGSSWLTITFVVWLVGLIGSALAIFKK